MKTADAMNKRRTVSERLRFWAEKTPEAQFIKCDSPWLTFEELEKQTDQLAAGFQELGVQKGDHVAVILPNRIEMVLVIFGLAKLGAVQVPLNTFLKGQFLQYQLKDSSAKYVIADQSAIAELTKLSVHLPDVSGLIGVGLTHEELNTQTESWNVDTFCFNEIASSTKEFRAQDSKMEDLVSIMYTSGTTGLPKGCMLSNGYYTAIPLTFFENRLVEKGDVIITPFPLFHAAGGVVFAMEALYGGLPIIFEPSFSANNFMRRATEEKATLAHFVGAMGSAILATPPSKYDRTHNLRNVTIMPMTPDHQIQFEERFGTVVFPLGYGQTEVSPATSGTLEMLPRKRATVGCPNSRLEITIRNDENSEVPIGEMGEICVRPREPEVMFQGYWQKPEETEKAFEGSWYHTGDLGVMDEDQYITFRGRKSDSLRRRGENIAAMELESAIARHSKISAVAVHAVASEMSEDDIKACIVLEPDQEFEPEELFSFFQETLPYFAVPRYVEFLDALPLTATGRVMKHILRKRPNNDVIDFDRMGFRIDRNERR